MGTMIEAQRRVTKAFIDQDPITLSLTPQTETVTAGGGRQFELGTPRDPQTFKLIPMTYDQRPPVTAGGVERIIDYTLLGEWDCIGEVWDLVELGPNEYLMVVAITDGHQYERKFLCERHLFQDARS